MYNSKIYNTIIRYPIVFFTIYFVYLLKPDLKILFPSVGRYETMFHYILLFYGFVIIINNFFIRKYLLKDRNVIFAIIFSVSITVTLVLNIKLYNINSIKTTLLTSFSILVMITGFSILREKYTKANIIKFIYYPTMIIKFVMSIISILFYVFNISIYVINKEELNFLGVRYVEVLGNKFTLLLYGVYKDPNFVALFSFSLLAIAVYILIDKEISIKKYEKILIYIFIITEYIMISLSNSRGIIYSIYLVLSISIVILFYNFYKEKRSIEYFNKTIIIIVMFIIGITFVQKIGSNIININTPKIYVWDTSVNELTTLAKYSENKKISDKKIVSNTDLSKLSELAGKEDSSEEIGNGRIAIWEDAISLYMKKPIFGIGPEMQKITSYYYSSELNAPTMLIGRSIHNSYLNVLLSFGAVGFIIIFLWLINIIINRIKFLFKGNMFTSGKNILLISLLILLSAYTFLDTFLINVSFQQIFTMFIIGIISYDKDIQD